MTRLRQLPPDDELMKMKAEGMSHAAIARRYDTSRQAVDKAVKAIYARLGRETVTNDKFKRYWPWAQQLHTEHCRGYFYDCLRLYTRDKYNLPPALDADESSRLARFVSEANRLRLVVYYDGDEPTGFVFRSRREGDGDAFLVER